MKIDKQNDGIAFNDEQHVYWNLESGIRYISVTTLIEKFGEDFDQEFWSKYKALEQLIDADYFKIEKKRLLDTRKFDKAYYLKTYNIDETAFNAVQQDILDKWHDENVKACERGTQIHAKLENEFLNSKVCDLKKYGLGGKFNVHSGDVPLDEGVYPEYLIHVDDGDLHLAGQIDLLIKNGSDVYIIDYKGLPLDTPILTDKGWSTMANLKVGDKVFDKDGNLCNVTVKSAIHHNPCYKINFDNAESVICDVDHRWLISFKLPRATKRFPTGYVQQVMTTMELKTYLDSIKNRNTYNIPKILNAKPLNIRKSSLPLDPYVLGVWLGDGSKNCGIITQATNSPLWDEIRNRGYEVGENLNHDPDRAGTDMRTVFNIRGILSSLGVLNNKHIPECYLLSSYKDRLDLLRGLMDTDGYYHPKRKRFVMTTSFEWQMEGMRQLLASLGCKVSVFNVVHKCGNKEFLGWDINFTTNKFNPFLVKTAEVNVLKDNNSFRNIESVEEVDTVPTQCIAVDSPSHTYLCTHSLIVTHNTNNKIETKGFYNAKTKSSKKMKYPLQDMDECNFSHYTLQLSMYAWMVQFNNPDVNIKWLKLIHFGHDDKITEYDVEYKKATVERLLRYWKSRIKTEERKQLRKPIEF